MAWTGVSWRAPPKGMTTVAAPMVESVRWGKPLAALLGALKAQTDLGVAAIGGKDSMSGSFEDLDAPTLGAARLPVIW